MNYYLDYRIKKFMNSESIRDKIIRRHNLDEVTKLVLAFCGDDIYIKYGTLATTVNSYEKDFTNEMGIMFVNDIDDNYLKLISLLFENYEFNKFDFPYYKNMGLIDINEIMKKYPNLSMSTIRDITMYSVDGDTRNKLFYILNEKNFDYQEKVCKLITPISMSLLNNNSYVNDEFYEFKYNLSNKDFNFDKDYLDELFCTLHEECVERCKNKKDYKKYMNLYFLCEFEYFFQELYMLLYSKIDDENLDMLLKVKEYVISTIPNPSGKIEVIPLFKTERYEYTTYSSAEEWEAAIGGTTEYGDELVHYADKIINTIKFQKKEILGRKKEIMIMMQEKIENDLTIDECLSSEKIVNLQCKKYIEDLMNYINMKDVKVKLNEIKRIKI